MPGKGLGAKARWVGGADCAEQWPGVEVARHGAPARRCLIRFRHVPLPQILRGHGLTVRWSVARHLGLFAMHLNQLPFRQRVSKTHGAEAAAPHATGVQPQHMGRFKNPSVDQCPKAIVVSAVRLPGTSNHGTRPAGACAALSVLSKSITPSTEQNRRRVMAFTMARSRSVPCSAASHRSGVFRTSGAESRAAGALAAPLALRLTRPPRPPASSWATPPHAL